MTGPARPVLDVMAVLAAQQQQLEHLTEVVQAQQRTLQRLVGDTDTASDATEASGPGGR